MTSAVKLQQDADATFPSRRLQSLLPRAHLLRHRYPRVGPARARQDDQLNLPKRLAGHTPVDRAIRHRHLVAVEMTAEVLHERGLRLRADEAYLPDTLHTAQHVHDLVGRRGLTLRFLRLPALDVHLGEHVPYGDARSHRRLGESRLPPRRARALVTVHIR